jgi:hypothetical protein
MAPSDQAAGDALVTIAGHEPERNDPARLTEVADVAAGFETWAAPWERRTPGHIRPGVPLAPSARYGSVMAFP